MTITETLIPAWSEMAEEEKRNHRIVESSAREIDIDNRHEVRRVFQILSDNKSVWHFVTPPRSVDHIKRFADRPDIHMMVFYNEAGTLASTLTIEDSPETETTIVNSHEISRVAVASDLQSPSDNSVMRAPGLVGEQSLIYGIRYGFNNPSYTNRRRKDLYLWITKFPGWDRMYNAARRVQFLESMEGEHFVTKKLPGGSEIDYVDYDAVRLDLPLGRYLGYETEGHYEEILSRLK